LVCIARLRRFVKGIRFSHELRQLSDRIVNVPVELFWSLLTLPGGWGDFYDVRITRVDPAGLAVVGQTVFGESGPKLLHLKLQFRFVEIDALDYKLGLDARLPFGIMVREDLRCVPLGPEQCRVNYNCGFGFPTGWRGAVTHFLVRRELDAGPADSLRRLQREAGRLHTQSRNCLSKVVKAPIQ
jgi:hypothetical protein